MHLSEIPQRLGHTKTILLIGLSLLGMLVFGYFLANIERQQLLKDSNRLTKTVANLHAENEQMRTESNQLKVKLELAELHSMGLKESLQQLQQDVFQLETEKAFYQHVVAPELTQDGFFIEGLEVSSTATPGYYKVSMVLLQQSAVKATVRGQITVSLTGSLAGKHSVLTSSKHKILPEGESEFGFRYFQTLSMYLQLPENFTPESISLTTAVYQYKRRRGEYEKTVNWPDVFIAHN